MRGQVPGTTCNGARATSAINNYQAPGCVRAEREWRAGTSSGTPEWTTRVEYPEYLEYPSEPPSRRGPVSRGPRPSTTPLAGVTLLTLRLSFYVRVRKINSISKGSRKIKL